MWELANEIGYKPISTFWNDFSIAESFGKKAINETAQKCFNDWKTDYKMLTELIMVINHKSWYWHEKNNEDLSSFYSSLYYKYDTKAYTYLQQNDTEEAITYYFHTLD